MNLQLRKASLRAFLLLKRKKLSATCRRVKSRKIFRKLFKIPLYQKAEKIAVYFDISPEVETRPFLRTMIKEKKVFLPRTDPAKKILTLHRVEVLGKDLRRGAYAIREPKKDRPRKPAAAMDLIVVPGVGFDRKGNRLGRGAGYYDRFLKRGKKVPKIGICFREQLVKKIPVTKRDVLMDRVITD